MNKKIIALVTLVTGLTLTALHAQQNDVVGSQSGRGALFAYADFYQYVGAGAPGQLVAEEMIANYAFLYENMYGGSSASSNDGDSIESPRTPQGTMVGATVGYAWARNVIQVGYRSGNIDSPVTNVFDHYYTNGEVYNQAVYQQKTNEIHVMYTIAPFKDDSLKFGAEYVYGTAKGTFRQQWRDVSIKPVGAWEEDWNYGFDSTTNDVLIHALASLKPLPLYTGRSFAVLLQPRVDMGIGYSLRSASLRQNLNTADFFLIGGAEKTLSDDAWIFEVTPAVGLSCVLGKSSILAEFGYRYRNSNLGSHFYGNDQHGVYARVGYRFDW